MKCKLSLEQLYAQFKFPILSFWQDFFSKLYWAMKYLNVLSKVKLQMLSYLYGRSQDWNCRNFLKAIPHCGYLDIYISRKIMFCVVDLEGKFQTNLQTKPITFLVWKFRSIIPIFLQFFAEFVKSTAFCTLCVATMSKSWHICHLK